MAIDPNVYPGQMFALYIAEEAALGTAETVDANFVSLDLNTPVDVSWGTGLNVDDTPRTGQLVSRPTDYFATPTGSTHEIDFEWAVSHKEGLDLLMNMISEDAASPYELAGTFLPPVYQDGVATGTPATVIVSNPNTDRDRTLPGCVLTELTLSIDNNTAGSRLVASGKLMSGYDVTIGANTVAPAGTETAYAPVVADMTTVTLGGSDLLLDSFNCTFGYGAIPLGSQGAGLEPELYARGIPLYTFEGEMIVKKDDNSAAALTLLENGGETAIIVTVSALGFTVTQAVITGYTPDLTGDKGGFVTIAFSGRADGAELLYSIAT